jgi:predicted ribosomally synthesized peptide with nif11-like leader
MSKETLDQFIQKVTDDEQLQSRIGEEMEADAFIALGAEHGCDFSADDLTAGAELSDEELDGVAGGAAYIKDAGIGRRGLDVGPVGRGGVTFRIGRGLNSSADDAAGFRISVVLDQPPGFT